MSRLCILHRQPIALCVTVVKEPPYQVAETGYGGFTMPIDVYMKNDGEPKKIRFQYELFLGTVGTVTHNRCEKITFQHPSPLFRERLVNGGAVSYRYFPSIFAVKSHQKIKNH